MPLCHGLAVTKLDDIFARGFAALESGDLDEARAATAAAIEVGADEDDARRRYFEFMIPWLDEATEDDEIDELLAELGDLPEQATKLANPVAAGRIVLDLADILIDLDEIDEAELALRSLGERKDLQLDDAADALVMRAHISMEVHEDIDEALALLDQVDPSMHERLGYISLRAAVLVELDRADEAIELLRKAITREDDTELHYQLGAMLRQHGDDDEATKHLLLVRERDLVAHEVPLGAVLPRDEVEDLRRHLEDVLDTLPEPVMAKLASAAIQVERWTSEDMVRAGADPRTTLAFEGQPATDDEDDGQVDTIIVYRDAIVAQIDSDDDIPGVLALSLVEEVDRFFDLELFPGD